MGLIRAAIGAISGTVADQWQEYFYCDAIEPDVVERFSPEYRQAEQTCEEIKEALISIREDARIAAAEAARPKTAVQCPLCGATVTPAENGKCEYCGGAIIG